MEIIDYAPELAHHFDQINRNWIEEYFVVEDIDNQVLLNPEKNIIGKGGAVYFAKENDAIVGTFALLKHSEETVELTKMGVYKQYRNRGIGKQLIIGAIEKAREMGIKKLILHSNRKLENAIHLYRKHGFTEIKITNAIYERCDIQMEMELTNH